MSRSGKIKSQLRRRAIRLALIVALSSNAAIAMGYDGPTVIPQGQALQVPELPVYPFESSVQQANKPKAATSRQALSRILGIGRSSNTVASQAPPVLPALGNASPPPMLTQPLHTQPLPKADIKSLQALIDHPSMPAVAAQPTRIPTTSLTLAVGNAKTDSVDASVVVAGATQKQSAVEISMSDLDQSTDSDSNMVNDLVNSLVAFEPNPPQLASALSSIDQDIVNEQSVNLNFSDRENLSELAQELASQIDDYEDSKTPTMIAFSDKVDTPKPERATANRIAESMATSYDAVATAVPEAKSLLQVPTSFDNTVQLATSSRRESSNVVEPAAEAKAPELHSSTRQTLLPMLALNNKSRASEPRALQPVPTSSPTTLPEANVSAQLQSVPKAVTQPATNVQSKDVRVAVKDSVGLQSTEVIQAISVEHEQICQAIQNGPKTFSVIGLQEGETRVAVISDSAGQRSVQIHRVVVNSPRNAAAKDGNSLAADISQTIAQLYPRQKVRVTNRGTQLVVSGTVDSEDTAKKILGLVRRTTLTPVVDELKTK